MDYYESYNRKNGYNIRRDAEGRYLSEESKRKISEANSGSTLSEETKQKISETLSGRILDEEVKENMSRGMKESLENREHPCEGIDWGDEVIEKRSEALKGREHTKEEIKKRTESLQEYYENNDAPKGSKHPRSKLNEQAVKVIKWELKKGNKTQGEIAEKFNVCKSVVSHISCERQWTHVEVPEV